MKTFYTLISLLLIVLCAPAVRATNYYVSSIIGNNSNTGTQEQPFATMQRAASLTNPGDTVFVMNGTYASVNNSDVLKITRSGTASQPIVYKNLPGHAPFIDFNGWNGIIVVDGTAYIVIDGFKIRGNNRNVTLSAALNQPSGCANPTGSPSPLYNGSGITVEGRNAGGHCHHVTIRNCEVYECGTSGINSLECDYITVENNLVYNNSWYTRYGGSGISFLHSWNFDNDTSTIRMIIRNNIVYGNQLFVPWRNGTVCEGITDGNGIIYDDNRNTQLGAGAIPFSGKALIENNVSFRNGGRGIHNFRSDNVVIRNNTSFQNCKSDEISGGEITIITGDNVKVYNNIMYARAGKRASSATTVTNFFEDNNMMYNSPLTGFYNTYDILADPLFADTANNDFRLRPNSPAINTGTNVAGLFSAADILGVLRPVGNLPDMGAYEFAAVPASSVNFGLGNIAVSRVGDGVSILGAQAAPVSIIEYDISGTSTGLGVVLGDASSLAPNRIVLSGDNTTGEGQLNLSSDGRYLSLAGYEGTVGSASASYQANDKVIARIAYNGVTDYTTRMPSSTFNRTIRSAVTENSNRFYITGTNVAPASNNSTRFLAFGSPVTTASTAFNSSVRSLAMFKGQVYYAQNNTVGSLTPNPAAGNYATNLPFPGVTTAGHNYQSLALIDMDATASYNSTGYDVLYCADLNLGLVKYFWNGTAWTFAGNFNPPSATGITGGLYALTARLNGAGNPEIFVVKGAAANNNIIALTDIGGFSGNIAATVPEVATLTSAGNGYMFRGIAFTPSQMVTLPIDLLSFKAYLINDRVLLNWATSSEINAKEFVIEKSSDGIIFSSTGKIAAENASRGKSYDFTDYQPGKGRVFYRLKSVDKDASFTYSKIISINIQVKAANKLRIFPNPVANYFSVSYPDAASKASLSIFSIDGKKTGEYNIAVGSSQRSIDASGLERGKYIIVYKNNNRTFTGSFIK